MTSLGSARSDQDPAPESPAVPVRAGGELWAVVLLAALAGVAFTTIQIMEKIAILKDPYTTLACDVNSTLSCTNVLNAWQSSVLGPPNSFIGAVMFGVLTSAALAGLLGSTLGRAYLAALWGLAVFFLSFASWFMYETAFSIHALCLWCVGITTALVLICATLTRLANRGDAFGDTWFGRGIAATVRTRLDLAIWGAWWLGIAALLWIGLGT